MSDATTSDDPPASAERGATGPTSGRRLVILLFGFVLCFVAVVGALLGAFVGEVDPQLLGVALPASPIGMATFGLITVGGGLAVLVAALAVVTSGDG